MPHSGNTPTGGTEMSLFDSLMGNAGNIDLGALAEKVGLNPDDLRNGGESLLSKLASGDHDADSATVAASAETGIAPDKLQALLPELSSALGNAGGDSPLAGIAGKLTGLFGGQEGGDGGALGTLSGFAKGLFGSKS
jgi:hypothetical protein